MSRGSQLFISVKLTPPLLYLMMKTERGKLLHMKWKSGGRVGVQEIGGELYLGRGVASASVRECRALERELLLELRELTPQLDEKEVRLYIIPQKILCSSYSDPALLEEQKF